MTDSADEDVESLIDAATAGSHCPGFPERARLLADAATSRHADRERFDELIDGVALRAGAGNDAALELLLELIHRLQLAAGAIRSRVVDATLAEDVAQQTLIAVERNISSYGGLAHFRTWLYAVARNEALMALRRSRPAVNAERAPDDGVRFTSVVANRLTISDLVNSLPQPYAETLRLQLFDDLGYEAIAVRLQIPVGTVRSRLSKAKDLLREALTEAWR